MAFPDITKSDQEEQLRKNAAKTFRRKVNSIIGHDVNEKAIRHIYEGDTVEVRLDGILRKAKVIKHNITTCSIFVPDTNETWRVSGYYLTKVKAKDEIF